MFPVPFLPSPNWKQRKIWTLCVCFFFSMCLASRSVSYMEPGLRNVLGVSENERVGAVPCLLNRTVDDPPAVPRPPGVTELVFPAPPQSSCLCCVATLKELDRWMPTTCLVAAGPPTQFLPVALFIPQPYSFFTSSA